MHARRRELEAAEAARRAEEVRAERAERERVARKADRARVAAERLGWRRWVRRCALAPEPAAGSPGSVRVLVRVAVGVGKTSRNVRVFSTDQDISALFNWVETLLLPADVHAASDPASPPVSTSGAPADPSRTHWPDERGGEVVRLYTTYPRKEVHAQRGGAGRAGWALVMEAGGSLVCEVDEPGGGADEEGESEGEGEA